MQQSNLFYLSGPHGSGKTTLAEELAKLNPDILVPELSSRCITFNAEPGYRHALKMCERAVESFEYLEIARKNPDKLILGNRCVYDVLAYSRVYYERGWITRDELRRYDAHAEELFQEENSSPYAIILNPEFEKVKAHLDKRWKEKGKKWREDDLEYARLACEAFRQFSWDENICYIGREIDLESKLEIMQVNEWMKQKKAVTEPLLAPSFAL